MDRSAAAHNRRRRSPGAVVIVSLFARAPPGAASTRAVDVDSTPRRRLRLRERGNRRPRGARRRGRRRGGTGGGGGTRPGPAVSPSTRNPLRIGRGRGELIGRAGAAASRCENPRTPPRPLRRAGQKYPARRKHPATRHRGIPQLDPSGDEAHGGRSARLRQQAPTPGAGRTRIPRVSARRPDPPRDRIEATDVPYPEVMSSSAIATRDPANAERGRQRAKSFTRASRRDARPPRVRKDRRSARHERRQSVGSRENAGLTFRNSSVWRSRLRRAGRVKEGARKRVDPRAAQTGKIRREMEFSAGPWAAGGPVHDRSRRRSKMETRRRARPRAEGHEHSAGLPRGRRGGARSTAPLRLGGLPATRKCSRGGPAPPPSDQSSPELRSDGDPRDGRNCPRPGPAESQEKGALGVRPSAARERARLSPRSAAKSPASRTLRGEHLRL